MPRIRELRVEYRPHPSGAARSDRQLKTAGDALEVIRPILDSLAVECFIVLHLDVRQRLLGVQEIARGGLSDLHVPIRSILAGCIGERNSSAIILAHNHPSGDPSPSLEDLSVTRQIQAACAIFQVEVVDHIILGDQAYCSFNETGRMRYL